VPLGLFKQNWRAWNCNADGVNTYIRQKFACYKEKTETLLVARKESGLEVIEVNADKTKCMVMFRDQNAG